MQDNSEQGDLLSLPMPSGFKFSAIDPSSLTTVSSMVTLVTLAIDVSGSVVPFEKTIEALAKETVLACQKGGASDQMWLRVITFSDGIDEVHGFKPVAAITPKDYDGKFRCSGRTALYDALLNSIEASTVFGATLAGSFRLAAAINFVVTDGQENESRVSIDPKTRLGCPKPVAKASSEAVSGEKLQSCMTIIMGLTNEDKFDTYLENVRRECNIQQAMVVGALSPGGPDVNAHKIAKLAGFIESSATSTSNKLNGGPSNPIPATLTI